MNKINISSKLIAGILAFISGFLVIISFVIQLIAYKTGHHYMRGIVPFFDVDEEINLPTFFSGLILLFASVLLILIFLIKKRRKDKDLFFWIVLSLGFLYMTFDELFMIHERYIGPWQKNLGGYEWVIPVGAIIIILSVVLFKYWLRLPNKTRFSFFIAAVLFVGGAIGFELVESYIAKRNGEDNLIYQFVATIQEGLEMFGVTLFIWSLLDYIAENFKELYFEFT